MERDRTHVDVAAGARILSIVAERLKRLAAVGRANRRVAVQRRHAADDDGVRLPGWRGDDEIVEALRRAHPAADRARVAEII